MKRHCGLREFIFELHITGALGFYSMYIALDPIVTSWS